MIYALQELELREYRWGVKDPRSKAEHALIQGNDKVETLTDQNRHLIEEKAMLQGQLQQLQRAL